MSADTYRIATTTAYKYLRSIFTGEQEKGDFVLKKLGNTFCIFHLFSQYRVERLVITISSKYITVRPMREMEDTIQNAFDTFGIQL